VTSAGSVDILEIYHKQGIVNPYAVVHYDLAIAKPAMQVQAAESLSLIMYSYASGHVEMAFFGVLGYLLNASGGPHILTEMESTPWYSFPHSSLPSIS